MDMLFSTTPVDHCVNNLILMTGLKVNAAVDFLLSTLL